MQVAERQVKRARADLQGPLVIPDLPDPLETPVLREQRAAQEAQVQPDQPVREVEQRELQEQPVPQGHRDQQELVFPALVALRALRGQWVQAVVQPVQPARRV